ncbi:hypothetical protein [Limnothrix sp. FACHB-406]|uniref:hypothetical protein n=1 Tax=Limnothrix sp. FACHB-406 TaxID=2692817 RepID=UPI00168A02A7|nr:hypothetical protein [Limnothrix sp. FACHB-406]
MGPGQRPIASGGDRADSSGLTDRFGSWRTFPGDRPHQPHISPTATKILNQWILDQWT